MTPRSWLFVPGDSPAKMAKALSSEADALILDLEDSVAPPAKIDARDQVAGFLRSQGARAAGPQLWVRINPLKTGLAEGDLASILAERPHGVVLPKIDGAEDLLVLDDLLNLLERDVGMFEDRTAVLPIATETPLSIFNLHTYGASTARLAGLTWGAEDLAAAIGAVSARAENGAYTPLYDLARSLCLAGAAHAQVPAVETVYPDFRDLDGLGAYLARGRRDGFVGMMAIHPSQVGPINAAFTPTEVELARAERIVALFEANPGVGALALDGQMLDAPHLLQARRVLARRRRYTASA
ncbi:HpcH/HpaI aldolase/citrate lyase family protein [Caulobacter soli]|uniref:HpcH/HpaI aldolase/citrate lyase family protein n=1 Tax=Caulobacter soli TaxID=2708539 RepID=UPI0013EAE3C4|nr:CoA ester lyase [Caulobacter soli]